ncbi:MAG: hypothetical protein ACE5LU_15920 [Anaerolineae bacterium]
MVPAELSVSPYTTFIPGGSGPDGVGTAIGVAVGTGVMVGNAVGVLIGTGVRVAGGGYGSKLGVPGGDGAGIVGVCGGG